MRPLLRLLYCTCAFLLLAPPLALAQQSASAATAYTTFIRGNPIGREDVTVKADAAGLVVTSEGRLGDPANLTIRRAEFRYGPDGAPQSFELNGTSNGGEITIRTTVTGNTASTVSPQSGSSTQPINPQAILHVNGIVGSYAALARRLGFVAPGSVIPVFVVRQSEIGARLIN